MKIKALLLCALLLSGCVKYTNLQDRGIVGAVGIDYLEGEYLVTMQVFSSDSFDENQIAKVITTRGKTISDAVENTALSQGKEFFLGHNRLVIIGESAKKLGLNEVLWFFITASDSRGDVKVLTTNNSAKELLSKIKEGDLPALGIEKTVENAYDNSKVAKTYLLDVLKYDHTLIPEISLDGLTGVSVYSGGEYQKNLSLDATRGALFLKDYIKTASYSIETEDFDSLSVQIYRSKTKILGETAVIEALCQVTEYNLKRGAQITENAVKIAENEIVKQITLQCNEALSECGSEFFSGVKNVTVRLQIARGGKGLIFGEKSGIISSIGRDRYADDSYG